MYSILIAGLVIYLTLRLFRFSIRLLVSLIRPIIFLLLILVSKILKSSCSTVYNNKFNYFCDFHSTDRIAISLRDKNRCHIKSCNIQCIISNWRHIPEHLRYIKFHLYAYNSILCKKLLIQRPIFYSISQNVSNFLFDISHLLYICLRCSFTNEFFRWKSILVKSYQINVFKVKSQRILIKKKKLEFHISVKSTEKKGNKI